MFPGKEFLNFHNNKNIDILGTPKNISLLLVFS